MTRERTTMNKLIGVTLMGLVMTLAACDKGDDKAAKKGDDKPAAKAPAEPASEPAEPAPSLDPKVEQAVELANKISDDPAAADAILSEAGLDRAAFEKLLYEIAKDPELSKSYAVARDA